MEVRNCLPDFFLLLDQGIKPQDLPAHPFVLLDERQIPHGHQQDARNKKQENHHPGQLVPDAKIDFHRAELITGRAATEANKSAPARG